MPDRSENARKLKSLRERAGLPVRRLATLLGKTASTYAHYESGYKKQYLPADLVEALVPILTQHGIPELEVRALAGMPHVYAGAAPALDPDQEKNPQNPREIVRLPSPTRDLPVLGAARGGDFGAGSFADNGQFFEMVDRPPALMGVTDAYAVYVVDESMEPRYFAGELVHVHPHKPPTPGSFVVVQLDDGNDTDYLIKRLVRRSGGKVTLEQYNPAKLFDVDAKIVKTIHRLVGTATPI